jgi:hypothetical protein
VRDLDDDGADLVLTTSTAQGDLTALERGMHALHVTEKGKHGLSIAAYAAKVGRPDQSVNREVNAAEVFAEATSQRDERVAGRTLPPPC